MKQEITHMRITHKRIARKADSRAGFFISGSGLKSCKRFALAGVAVLVSLAVFPLFGDFPPQYKWETPMKYWYRAQKKPWLAPGTVSGGFSADGTMVALSKTNRTIEVVRLDTREVVQVFDFSFMENGELPTPSSVAYSAGDHLFAIAFSSARKVLVVDYKKQKIAHRISLDFHPRYLRFSQRGRFVLIGDESNRDAYRSIYSIRRRKFFLNEKKPVVCDFSRDDSYFYRYHQGEYGGAISWSHVYNKQEVRRVPLSRLGSNGRLYSLRVLRDHRVALGFAGHLFLVDRYLQRSLHHYLVGGRNRLEFLLPSHDNRYIITGNSDSQYIVRMHNGSVLTLKLPEGVRELDVYPGGNYLLYSNRKNALTRIDPVEM